MKEDHTFVDLSFFMLVQICHVFEALQMVSSLIITLQSTHTHPIKPMLLPALVLIRLPIGVSRKIVQTNLVILCKGDQSIFFLKNFSDALEILNSFSFIYKKIIFINQYFTVKSHTHEPCKVIYLMGCKRVFKCIV